MSDSIISTSSAIRRLPQPEPGLTPDMAVSRARALRGMLRAQQEEADARGWYTDEVHKAILDAGLYRILQPKLFGGYEFEPATLIRTVIEISRGHPSSGWCFCLGSSHVMVASSHFSAETQAELFGETGDFPCPASRPAGRQARTRRGRLSREWFLELFVRSPGVHSFHGWRADAGSGGRAAAQCRFHRPAREYRDRPGLGRRCQSRHARFRLTVGQADRCVRTRPPFHPLRPVEFCRTGRMERRG